MTDETKAVHWTAKFAGGLRALAGMIERRQGKPAADPTAVLDEYVESCPSAQNAIDAIPGWNNAFPPEVGVSAGHLPLYADNRIVWALAQFGALAGCRVLELGPLEGSHSYLLQQHGAAVIEAVEANKLSFLRCLVTKELLNLDRVRFRLGNFVPFLEQTETRYDLIVASGVLYHMADPIHLLELIARRSEAFYIWTHYVSEAAMPASDYRRGAFLGPVETRMHNGVPVRLQPRGYHGAWTSKAFCGGMHDLHYWMDRDDILALIRSFGFDDIRVEHEEPAHPNGPSFSIFARRTSGTAAQTVAEPGA